MLDCNGPPPKKKSMFNSIQKKKKKFIPSAVEYLCLVIQSAADLSAVNECQDQ
jgi:hypothetical protein